MLWSLAVNAERDSRGWSAALVECAARALGDPGMGGDHSEEVRVRMLCLSTQPLLPVSRYPHPSLPTSGLQAVLVQRGVVLMRKENERGLLCALLCARRKHGASVENSAFN